MLRLALRAGGAVAGVADGVVAGERRQALGREDVGDEPGVLVQPSPLPSLTGDPRRLLAAVLEGEQTEEGELRDAFAVRRRQAEHAALLVRACRRQSSGRREHASTSVMRTLHFVERGGDALGSTGYEPGSNVAPVSRS